MAWYVVCLVLCVDLWLLEAVAFDEIIYISSPRLTVYCYVYDDRIIEQNKFDRFYFRSIYATQAKILSALER